MGNGSTCNPGGPCCWTQCHDGSTPSPCFPNEAEASPQTRFPTYMAHAMHPLGPFSAPVMAYNGTDRHSEDGDPPAMATGDTNFAGVILDDGSLVGMWKGDLKSNTTRHRRWSLASYLLAVSASDWRQPATYRWGHAVKSSNVFPQLVPGNTTRTCEVEDPTLWYDKKKRIVHAVVHNWEAGGHAASADRGKTWRWYGGNCSSTAGPRSLDWSRSVWPPSFNVTGERAVTPRRRERPHILLDNDGVVTAITSALQVGSRNATWTLVQETNHEQSVGSHTSPGPVPGPVVVIVPGSLHSVLEMALDGVPNPPAGCPRDLPWTAVYPNRTWLRPPLAQCWIWYMRRIVQADGSTQAPAGVRIRAAAWGSINAIPSKDPWTWPNTSSYTSLVAALVAAGSTPSVQLFAAPYDWRFAPDELAAEGWFEQLAELIRAASKGNNGAQVWLVAHSSGPSYLQSFFAQHCPAALLPTIAGVVSLNGNFAGEIDCLETLWHGGTFGPPAVWDAAAYRATQATWGITAWCLPQAVAYGSRPLVTVANQYTHQGIDGRTAYMARDVGQLIAAVGLEKTMLPIYNRVANLTTPDFPGIPYVCLYGTGVPTPVLYTFDASGPRPGAVPQVSYSPDGDGQQDATTNRACDLWPAASTRTQAFAGADHDNLLADPRALAVVVKTLRGGGASVRPEDKHTYA